MKTITKRLFAVLFMAIILCNLVLSPVKARAEAITPTDHTATDSDPSIPDDPTQGSDPVDFTGIDNLGAAAGWTGITETCPPVLEPISWANYYDQYILCDFGNKSYVVYDAYGKVVWQLPEDVKSMHFMENTGFIIVSLTAGGSQVYHIDGRLLLQTPYDMTTGYDGAFEEVSLNGTYILRIIGRYGFDEREKTPSWLLFPDGKKIEAEVFGSRFCRSLIPCRRDGLWGLEDTDGKVFLPHDYENLLYANDDVFACKQNNKWALIRADGTQITDYEYDRMNVLKNDDYRRVAVCQGNQWGVIDLTGRIRVPIQYGGVFDTDYTQYSGTPVQWYAVDNANYILSEGGVYSVNGDPVLLRDTLILGDDLILRRAENSTSIARYELVNKEGTRVDPQLYYDYVVFDHGYCLFYGKSDEKADARVYDKNHQLLCAFEKVGAEDSLGKFASFGATTDCFAVQFDSPLRVEIYDNNGVLKATIQDAFLNKVLNKQTFTFYTEHITDTAHRKKMYAFCNADASYISPFQYNSGFISPYNSGFISPSSAEGSFQFINAGTGNGTHKLMHNSGIEILPYTLSGSMEMLRPQQPYGFGVFTVEYGYGTDYKSGIIYIPEPELCFTDVNYTAWYAESVGYCVKAGLMKGMGNLRFAPNQTMTRAMLVQVLYNISGSRCEPYGFTDVSEGQWFYDAVNWAAAKGIIKGVSEDRFAPSAPVTREQMVTILHRYALGFCDAEAKENVLDVFEDKDRISSFAQDAMKWAVTTGLIQGLSKTTVGPQGGAKRAQIAAVLMRFVHYMSELQKAS